ncbi:MAG: hypothetical protein PHH23_01550 [Paludibacteraceae bacterium]|nr:hypothetical protein [Paludibacteraceae bacterium]
MKAKKVTYQRCFNLGNYQNEVIGIELEVEDGDKAQDVLDNARKFVEKQRNEDDSKRKECESIVANPDDYTGKRVNQAAKWLEENRIEQELPF